MRKLIALVAFVAATGCSSDSSTNAITDSIAGSYTLKSMDGNPLPNTFQSTAGTVTLTSDVITVAQDGTWSEVGSYTLTQNGTTSEQTFTDGGPWTRAGTTVSFFSTYLNANAYSGTYTGQGFVLSDTHASYLFLR